MMAHNKESKISFVLKWGFTSQNNVLFFGTSFSWDEYHVRLTRSKNNSVYSQIYFHLSFLLDLEYCTKIEIARERETNARRERERERERERDVENQKLRNYKKR